VNSDSADEENNPRKWESRDKKIAIERVVHYREWYVKDNVVSCGHEQVLYFPINFTLNHIVLNTFVTCITFFPSVSAGV
jgi:hypothetical protein